MDAGLVNPTFWVSMMVALSAAFVAAFPVNRWLLARGRGYALTHDYHDAAAPTGWRRFVPDLSTEALTAAIIAFLLGGLAVSIADSLGDGSQDDTQAQWRQYQPLPALNDQALQGVP